ncbi:hypothetical protein [Streptomyces sp. NPDC046332]|uniref:hypothetical protein n=1 Tax=Streptomyces sp. NPDC046332 TaxID=3155133 RepID=UPI0033E262CA
MSAHPVSHVIPEGAPRSGVIHVRHRHTERFTVVGTHLAQHEGLSAAAIVPVAPAPPPGPPPLTTCDGCERAFRSHDPDDRCGDCRAAA